MPKRLDTHGIFALVLVCALLIINAGCDSGTSTSSTPDSQAGAGGQSGTDAGGQTASDSDIMNNGTGDDGGTPQTDGATSSDMGSANACGQLSDCAGDCIDIQGDSRHCGGCNEACGMGQACVDSACIDVGYACADRIIGSVGDGVTLTDTTLGRGSNADGLCLRSGSDEDMVMFWRVPEGGDWQIRFSSPDFDVVARADLAAIPNFCAGNELACNDDGNGPNGALLSFTALEGQDILITVDAFRNTGAGEFTMSFSRSGEAPVSNGACDNASDLMAFSTGLNIFAAVVCFQDTCREAPEPGACVAECVPTLVNGTLSAGCAGCFGEYADCVIDACGADCLNGTLSCDDCDYSGLCGTPFSECAGL